MGVVRLVETDQVQRCCNSRIVWWCRRNQRSKTTLTIYFFIAPKQWPVIITFGWTDSSTKVVKMAPERHPTIRGWHVLVSIFGTGVGMDVVNVNAHVRKTPWVVTSAVLPWDHQTNVATGVHGRTDFPPKARRTVVIVGTHLNEEGCKTVGKVVVEPSTTRKEISKGKSEEGNAESGGMGEVNRKT